MPNVRGLTIWLQQNKLLRDINIAELKGTTVGVDAWKYFSTYLPVNTFCETLNVPQVDELKNMVNVHVKLFAKYKIKPIFVFPGVSPSNHVYSLINPPAPEPVVKKNNKKNKLKKTQTTTVSADDLSLVFNNKNATVRDNAWSKVEQNATEYAADVLNSISDVGQFTAAQREVIIETLHNLNVNVMIAPYSTVAQLAWLDNSSHKMTHLSYGFNDLLMYCVSNVILNLNLVQGIVSVVSFMDIINEIGINHTQFIHSCFLAGYMGASTFAALDPVDNRQQFNFSKAIALLVEHSSLQAVINSYKFKSNEDKLTYCKKLNYNLNIFEGALCLGPSGQVIRVRDSLTNSERVVELPNVPVKASEQTYPAIPIPQSIASLVSTGAVNPFAFGAIFTGKHLDFCPGLPSAEAHKLLDWLNVHVRGPSIRFSLAAITSTNPLYKDAFKNKVRDGEEPITDTWGVQPSSITNVRWDDQYTGQWPRDLVPKTDSILGRALIGVDAEVFVKDIAHNFALVADKISSTVNDTVSLSTVLMGLTKTPVSTSEHVNVIFNNTRSYSIAAVLITLYNLGFVDINGNLTAIGKSISSTLLEQSLIIEDSIILDSLVHATILARAGTLDSRIITVLPCDASKGDFKGIGRSSDNQDIINTRIISRVLSTISSASVPIPKTVTSDHLSFDTIAISSMTNIVIDAVKYSFENGLATLLSLGLYSAGCGISEIDQDKVRPCDLTQISTLTTFPVYALSTIASQTLTSLREKSEIPNISKTYIDSFSKILQSIETSFEVSISSQQISNTLSVLH